MLATVDWMKDNYAFFNEKYWNGELPECDFSVGRSKKKWGAAECKLDRRSRTANSFRIILSNYMDTTEYTRRNILLHEMIHIAEYFYHPDSFIRRGHNAHGSYFMLEADRLNRDGWDVTVKVSEKVREASSLSAVGKKSEARIRSKAEKKFQVLVGTHKKEFTRSGYETTKTLFVLPKNVECAWGARTLEKNFRLSEIESFWISDTKYANLRGSLRKGWFITEEYYDSLVKSRSASEAR